ncbi:MAG: hypothetical protein WD737_03990 [Gemmatimonadota bacterium]
MNRVTEYQIVVGLDPEAAEYKGWDKMADDVGAMIKEGWQPLGGIGVEAGQRKDGSAFARYFQAIAKYAQ